MSPLRLAIAALTVVVLAVLMAWQFRRERIVKACLDRGGAWYGAHSLCKAPHRPILRRDLERSSR